MIKGTVQHGKVCRLGLGGGTRNLTTRRSVGVCPIVVLDLNPRRGFLTLTGEAAPAQSYNTSASRLKHAI